MTNSRPPRAFDTRNPLESFDPRYRDVLRAALKDDIELKFESPGQARHFQLRLQMYRKRLLDAKDPEARTFYMLKTSRKDNILRITHADQKFDNILDQFARNQTPSPNYIPSEVPESPTPDPYRHTDEQNISIDDLFAGLQINEVDEPNIPEND